MFGDMVPLCEKRAQLKNIISHENKGKWEQTARTKHIISFWALKFNS